MKTLIKIMGVIRYLLTEIIVISFIIASIILLWSDKEPTIKDIVFLVIMIGFYLFNKLEIIEEKTKKKEDE